MTSLLHKIRTGKRSFLRTVILLCVQLIFLIKSEIKTSLRYQGRRKVHTFYRLNVTFLTCFKTELITYLWFSEKKTVDFFYFDYKNLSPWNREKAL